MPIILVKRDGDVTLDRDDQGFFRVTILPELAYSLFRVAQDYAQGSRKKLVVVPSQIVLRSREDGERFYEWYLELQSLIDNIDIQNEGDNREKAAIREKMGNIVNFYRKNRQNMISASFGDIVTNSSRIQDISYYPSSDQIMIGNREGVKLKESDLLVQELHETGHRADRNRVADKLDKEIFAFDKTIKWLMDNHMYSEYRHEEMIDRMNSDLNVKNVVLDEGIYLAEKIISSLERQYRDPVYYDDYSDEEIERFSSDPNSPEEIREADEWHQRNREQSDSLRDTAQNSWEVYGQALEQAFRNDFLTNKQLENYRWIESPEQKEFRLNNREKYGEILKDIYNLGEDHYRLREIGWHKRTRRNII